MKKKTFINRLFCPLLAIIISLNTALPALAAELSAGWPAAPEIASETGILMEADTGQILFDKGMDEVRYPASTTKILTALLILENEKDLNAQVTFTDVILPDLEPGNSTINAQVGEILTVEQCLYAILLASANEVCTQMAIHTAGSADNFVAMMNQRAGELGCINTNFTNSNGLPDENHYTTAHDLALILAEAVKNEAFCKIAGAAAYTIPPTNMTAEPRNLENSNALLTESEFHYEGAVAGKTGHTEIARNTLVTAAKMNDMTMICVVLRSEENERFTDTRTLFDYGFQNFYKTPLYWTDPEIPVGAAILPNNVTPNSLMVKDQDEDSLRTRIYSYQDREIFRTSMTLPPEPETKDISDTPDTDTLKSASGQKNLNISLIFTIIMIVLSIMCIITAAFLIKEVLYQKKHQKKKKKSKKKL